MSNQDTTQGKFRKQSKKDSEQPQIEENEVRIKGNLGNVKRYVDYACGLLQGIEEKEDKPTGDVTDEKDSGDAAPVESGDSPPKASDEATDANENKTDDPKATPVVKKTKIFKTIVLKATGRAINKAVTTAEVVKRRIVGLHQETKLETLEIVDVWEPTEEGLKTVETTRRVASITITLTLDESKIATIKESTGYQQPIPADSIKTMDYIPRRGRGRRGMGYRNRNRGGMRRNMYNNRNYGGRRGGGYGGYGGYGGRRGGGGRRNMYGDRNNSGGGGRYNRGY